ncbi:hypothetical protein [uncultured Thiodictyon sp.]|uniref:hypothetical protein n=1 Tax=uncultured Thiodictyon sp. TaxID=1846217 RepID=UPI0025EB1D68|nr:hypothetical protein [uncultured Thiodictyon sp.]
MNMPMRRRQTRELRFLGCLALSGVLIALYLDQALRLTAHTGGGYRVIDTQAVTRRIESGELRDREAAWYRPSTPDETGGHPP